MAIIDGQNGGIVEGAGAPEFIPALTLTVDWTLPEWHDNPAAFEVVAYTGVNPDTVANQLFAPISVSGSARQLVKTLTPREEITGVKAAVRAVYV